MISSCNRAIVLHEIMNVTVKLPDELCKAARHRAVDEEKSLSKWLAEIVEREISKPTEKPKAKTWMELIGDPATAHLDFELPDRKEDNTREFSFDDE